ncbi:anaerobic glycerol-3-phosphate dehydrogenase subunit C [Escherichia coli]|nr:anaerobic glycerol-3-phosphate dehydrogenase subunit C [Escherichia coli]
MNDTSFENCIKCTVCTTACPVSRVNPGYPGPKQAGPDGERLRLKDGALYDEALKYCINCKRCEVACPSDVKIGDIIQRARAKYDTTRPSLRNFVLSHTDLMGSVSTPFAPIVNTATSLKPVRQLLDAALKIDHRRTLPKYSFGTFRRWYRSIAAQQAQYKDQVAFFHGCFVNYNHPQLGKDLIKVLNAMGTGVQLLSKEKCCGVPLIANGFTDKARKTGNYECRVDPRSCGSKRHSGDCHLLNLYICPARRIPGSAECRQQRLARSYRTGNPLAVAQAGRRQNVTAETAAAESGLSHSVPYGKNGLDALHPGAVA